MRLLISFLIVMIGGGAGSAMRYLFSLFLSGSGWPFGTIAANCVGSFVIGAVAGCDLVMPLPPRLRLLAATGFCGGLTTMSSFVFETSGMVRTSEFMQAAIYAGITLAGSFASFVLGMLLVRVLVRTNI